MSYRDPQESLEDPIDKILEGINEFDLAVDKRIENRSEWQEEHLKEIADLSLNLRRLKFSLVKIKEETW